MKPKVSVVMNSYQDLPRQLKQAIRSYRRQKNVQVQLIVSTVKGDRAVRLAKKLGARVVVSSEPGIYEQLNQALSVVKGDWFAYASGNDVALPTKLIDEVQLCKKGKKVCYSAFYVADKDLVVTNRVTFPSYNYSRHLQGNFVADVALMHRSVLEKYKPFQTQFGNFAFWDFWLRAGKLEPGVFVYNPKPEWIYRIGQRSRHVRKRRSALWIAREKEERKKMLASHGRITK